MSIRVVPLGAGQGEQCPVLPLAMATPRPVCPRFMSPPQHSVRCVRLSWLTVSFISDVGRSCVLVSIGGKNVMFDCGMHMGYNDAVRAYETDTPKHALNATCGSECFPPPSNLCQTWGPDNLMFEGLHRIVQRIAAGVRGGVV